MSAGADIDHTMGADLSVGSGGDLAIAQGDVLVRERVLRRLLTNRSGYIWQLDYGGGLAAAVGMPVDLASIAATVRDQLGREAAVARIPAPTIAAAGAPDGTVTLTITYSDASTGTAVAVSIAQDN